MYLTSLNKNELYQSELDSEHYPYSTPIIKQFNNIIFSNNVTIIVGASGTGKSALIEFFSQLIQSRPISHPKLSTTIPHQYLEAFYATWKVEPVKSTCIKSTDFTNYLTHLAQLKKNALIEIESIEKQYGNSKDAQNKKLESLQKIRQLFIDYGVDLTEMSESEAYFEYLKSKLASEKLILIDSPEVFLSIEAQYQMALLIFEYSKTGNQFVITSSSPILASIPQATLYEISEDVIHSKTYIELECVNFMKTFLDHSDDFF